MRTEPKRIIAKGVTSKFLIGGNYKFTHYYHWFNELDRSELIEVNQLYKVVRDESIHAFVDEDHDGNEDLTIERCEECHCCGDWFTEDEGINEYDHGEYYCDECAKDLVDCPACGKEFIPNDDYPVACAHCAEAMTSKGPKFVGIVKWNGDHYFSGAVVKGSKVERRGDSLWLYDDEENYVSGLGDLTRYAWVEIEDQPELAKEE